MAIQQKVVDISSKELTKQQYAESTKGIYMNMLCGCRWDPVDNKYKMAPIVYSDVPLEGEKVKYGSGQEFVVNYSCLAEEFAHKTEVKDMWWKKAQEIVDMYKEQCQIEDHIKSHNTDLKKLRKEGVLKDQEDLDKE
ncbi:MAG: hypothetical protein ACI4V7_00900 [Succinivibrionaceae bacterium]|jgi:hypothetical protein